MESQVGQLQAQLAQTQAELQYAIEQIRVLTMQVNSNVSAATTVAAPVDTKNVLHFTVVNAGVGTKKWWMLCVVGKAGTWI